MPASSAPACSYRWRDRSSSPCRSWGSACWFRPGPHRACGGRRRRGGVLRAQRVDARVGRRFVLQALDQALDAFGFAEDLDLEAVAVLAYPARQVQFLGQAPDEGAETDALDDSVEFQALAEGYQWRKEQEQVLAAGFVASLINTCSTRDLKSAVTVDMLLGRQSAKQQSKTSDQAKADMKALLAEVG